MTNRYFGEEVKMETRSYQSDNGIPLSKKDAKFLEQIGKTPLKSKGRSYVVAVKED